MQLIEINQETVKQILLDKELYDRVSDDSISYNDYMPPLGNLYLGIFKDNVIIGFWSVDTDTSTTLNIHCNVIEKYRSSSLEVGSFFLDYIFNRFPCVQKLNCKIPVKYKDVYHFTKKFGFKDEGIDKRSIIKDGDLMDRYSLGITRTELENGVR